MFKNYNLTDRGTAKLDGDIVPSDVILNLVNIEELPESNSAITLVQSLAGVFVKSEKIYYTTRTGNVLTGVTRGYAGSTAKSFNDGDDVRLNIIAEHIIDIQVEVARLETDKSNTGHTHTFDSLTSKPTTLFGYWITDAYTETETDALFSLKANLEGGNTYLWDQHIVTTVDDWFWITRDIYTAKLWYTYIWSFSDNHFSFFTNSTEKARLTSVWDFLIWTTTSSWAKLEVNWTVRASLFTNRVTWNIIESAMSWGQKSRYYAKDAYSALSYNYNYITWSRDWVDQWACAIEMYSTWSEARIIFYADDVWGSAKPNELMRLDGRLGYIGIGKVPSYDLDVAGTIYGDTLKYSSGSFRANWYGSDIEVIRGGTGTDVRQYIQGKDSEGTLWNLGLNYKDENGNVWLYLNANWTINQNKTGTGWFSPYQWKRDWNAKMTMQMTDTDQLKIVGNNSNSIRYSNLEYIEFAGVPLYLWDMSEAPASTYRKLYSVWGTLYWGDTALV